MTPEEIRNVARAEVDRFWGGDPVKLGRAYRVIMMTTFPMDAERYTILDYLIGKHHTKDLTTDDMRGVLASLNCHREGDRLVPDPDRVKELQKLYRSAQIDAGQQEIVF